MKRKETYERQDNIISGTKIGGLKAREKNLASNPNYYIELGKRGGVAKNPKKGFGSKTPEERAEFGRKGGLNSRKKK